MAPLVSLGVNINLAEEERECGRSCRILWAMPGSCIHHFCPHSVIQTSVSCSHENAKGAGKCGPWLGSHCQQQRYTVQRGHGFLVDSCLSAPTSKDMVRKVCVKGDLFLNMGNTGACLCTDKNDGIGRGNLMMQEREDNCRSKVLSKGIADEGIVL